MSDLNLQINTNVSSEKLCFWVWFCYTFELYREGALIFRKIEKGNVKQDFYSIIKKIGEACEVKHY